MTEAAHFGRLATIYRWMEYLSFGPYLTQCRCLRIDEMTGCGHTLVYGDGDGRFLAELARRAPGMRITAIDASSEMLNRAARRLPPAAQVRLIHADALSYEPEQGAYDLVVSHFFLDCFSEQDLAMLTMRVNAATGDPAVWVVSDFAISHSPVMGPLSRVIVGGLYVAFGLLTGLRTRRLPDHARVLQAAGWALENRRQLLGGLLMSERWRRQAADV